jgi:hypothetical protein
VETLEPRLLLSSAPTPGSILGRVFADGDRDGRPGVIEAASVEKLSGGAGVTTLGQERGLAGWTVYLDEDFSGTRDPGERSTVTDAAGGYRFDGLAATTSSNPGIYDVGIVAQPGWLLGTNVSPLQTVAIENGQTVQGIDFGLARDIQRVLTVDNQGKGAASRRVTLDLDALNLPKKAEWFIDWGDGSSERYDKAKKQLKHTYAQDGLYEVKVVLGDDSGRFRDERFYAEVGDTSKGLYVPDLNGKGLGGFEFDDQPGKVAERISKGVKGRKEPKATAAALTTSALPTGRATLGASGNEEAGLLFSASEPMSSAALASTSGAGSRSIELLPLHDAYVRSGFGPDYGDDADLTVKNQANTNYDRMAFLRFDVSAFAGATGPITLRLMPLEAGSSAAPIALQLHEASTDAWDERSITYANKPATVGNLIASQTNVTLGTPVVFDITAAVLAAAAGDGLLSLRLYAQANGSTATLRFASRDHADPALRPVIVGTANLPTVSITLNNGDAQGRITPDVPANFTFTVGGAAPANSRWRIDWGDGSAIQETTGSSVTLDHTYAGYGPYTIKAVAIDPRNGQRLSSNNDYASVIHSQDPLAYWRLGDAPATATAGDDVAGLDGAYAQRPAGSWWAGQNPLRGQSSWRIGDVDTSADLHPAYVRVNHDSSLLLNQGTISFWMRNSGDVKNAGLVSKDVAGFGNGGDLAIFTKPLVGTSDDAGYLQARLQTAPGSTTAGTPGTVIREVWNNQSSGLDNFDFNDPELPPSSTTSLSSLDAPQNIGDNYLSRTRGYLVAPNDGSYTFWISGNQDSRFYLSSDEDPAGKQLLAHLTGWSNVGEYTKFPTQKSAPVVLTKGQRYYFEVQHLDTTGSDHVRVAWSLPGQSTSAPTQTIPGTSGGKPVLLPFDDASGGSRIVGTPANAQYDPTQWQHVAYSWGGNQIRLYLNGQEVASNPYTGGLGTTSGGAGNTNDLILGAYNGVDPAWVLEGIAESFQGQLDEVAIFDSQLSAASIYQQYFAESGALQVEGAAPPVLGQSVIQWTFDNPTNLGDTTLPSDYALAIASGQYASQGLVKGAASFTGGDAAVSMQGDQALNGQSAFSVTAWIKPNQVGTNAIILSGQAQNATTEALTIAYDTVGDVGGASNIIKIRLMTTAGPVVLESLANQQTPFWQHLAVTWKSGESLKLYLNGQLIGTSHVSAPVTGTVTGLDRLVVGTTWNGLFDRTDIYQYALGATEIRQLATASDKRGGVAASPIDRNGDFNGDSWVDAADVDLLRGYLKNPASAPSQADLYQDSLVDTKDLDHLMLGILGLSSQGKFGGFYVSDLNLDGYVNSDDATAMVASFTGTQTSPVPGIGWGQGDRDGDGDVDFGDAIHLRFTYLFDAFTSRTLDGNILETSILYGGRGNDTITGTDSNDYLWGGSGHDTVNGGLGNDNLHGGLGNDLLYGGAGTNAITDLDASVPIGLVVPGSVNQHQESWIALTIPPELFHDLDEVVIDWGDGQTTPLSGLELTILNSEPARSLNVSHTYAAAGSFQIVATAQMLDGRWLRNPATAAINVVASPPTFSLDLSEFGQTADNGSGGTLRRVQAGITERIVLNRTDVAPGEASSDPIRYLRVQWQSDSGSVPNQTVGSGPVVWDSANPPIDPDTGQATTFMQGLLDHLNDEGYLELDYAFDSKAIGRPHQVQITLAKAVPGNPGSNLSYTTTVQVDEVTPGWVVPLSAGGTQQADGRSFLVPGAPGTTSGVEFVWEYRDPTSTLDNEIGYYRVLDTQGSVPDPNNPGQTLQPGDPGYQLAALHPGNSAVVFRSGSTPNQLTSYLNRPVTYFSADGVTQRAGDYRLGDSADLVKEVQLDAGDRIAFYVVAGSSTATWRSNQSTGALTLGEHAWLSYSAANSDADEHFQKTVRFDHEYRPGVQQYKIEDLSGRIGNPVPWSNGTSIRSVTYSDYDFNDMVFSVSAADTATIDGSVYADINVNHTRDFIDTNPPPDNYVVFVVDKSGSTNARFVGSIAGVDKVIQAELRGFRAIVEEWNQAGRGDSVFVKVVTFDDDASIVAWNPFSTQFQNYGTNTAGGEWILASYDDPADADTVSELEELFFLAPGAAPSPLFTPAGWTDFNTGLQSAWNLLDALQTGTSPIPDTQQKVIFVSDGKHNQGPIQQALRGSQRNEQVLAFGAGADTDLQQLQLVGDYAARYLNQNDLIAGMFEANPLEVLEPGVGGIPVYADLNNNGLWDTNEPQTVSDLSGRYLLQVPAGSSQVRALTGTTYNVSEPFPASSFSYTLASGDLASQNFGLDPATSVTLTTDRTVISESSPGVANLTVTRTGDLSQDLRIDLRITGDAFSDVDYVPINPFVVIPAGSSSISFNVRAIDDHGIEGLIDRVVDIALRPRNDFKFGAQASVSIAIQDNEPGGPATPVPGVGVSAWGISSSEIKLSWNDPYNDETAWIVETSKSGYGNWEFFTQLPPDTTTFTETGLAPSTQRYYRITADSPGQAVRYSNVASARTYNTNGTYPGIPSLPPGASPGPLPPPGYPGSPTPPGGPGQPPASDKKPYFVKVQFGSAGDAGTQSHLVASTEPVLASSPEEAIRLAISGHAYMDMENEAYHVQEGQTPPPPEQHQWPNGRWQIVNVRWDGRSAYTAAIWLQSDYDATENEGFDDGTWTVIATPVFVDLDIDSDNNNNLGAPDRSDAEDQAEDAASKGKLVAITNGDLDTTPDGIPDYADPRIEGGTFVPLVIDLPKSVINTAQASQVTLTFDYLGSDPNLPAPVNGIYPPPNPNPIRLWLKNASQSRTSSDYITPGSAIDVSTSPWNLAQGGTKTIYVEGVNLADGAVPIKMTAQITGSQWSGSLEDTIHVIPAGMTIAVDANRDNWVRFDSSDVTAAEAPYWIWLNNDADGWNSTFYPGSGNDLDIAVDLDPADFTSDALTVPLGSEHLVGSNPPTDYLQEIAKRDLEDVFMGGIRIPEISDWDLDSLEFELLNTAQAGNPAIRLFALPSAARSAMNLAESGFAGDAHVKDATVADAVATDGYSYANPARSLETTLHLSEINGSVSLDATQLLSWASLAPINDSYIIPFLFEGVSPGQAALQIGYKLKNANGDIFQGSSQKIELDLTDFTDFYDTRVIAGSAGNNPQLDPFPTTATDLTLPSSVQKRSDAQADDYFLFVHGWSMDNPSRTAFAETSFKRLWWNGFKGRSGMFSWPTDKTTDYIAWDLLADADNYRRSEFAAYRSGESLRALMEDLTDQGKNVHVLAHSMGGIVASEALRLQSVSNQPLKKIAESVTLTQAAMSADAFDPSAPQRNPQVPDPVTGTLIPFNYVTADLYSSYPGPGGNGGSYFADIDQATDKLINLYNPSDYALATPWRLNQSSKTSRFTPGIQRYKYLGNPATFDDISHRFSEGAYDWIPDTPFDPLDLFTPDWIESSPLLVNPSVVVQPDPFINTYEILAFASQSRSEAIGATNMTIPGPITDQGPLNTTAIGFGATRQDHSRQFYGTMADTQGYWSLYIQKAGL